MNETSWMNDPSLSGIDPAKMQMLFSFLQQAQGKNQNELLPVLMAAASQSKNTKTAFQPGELEAIVAVLKAGKSPQEAEKIDRMWSLMKQFAGRR